MQQQETRIRNLPPDILIHHVFVHFEYLWIIKIARLVCPEWNQVQEFITPSTFEIKYLSSKSRAHQLLASNKLHLVTHLKATFEHQFEFFLPNHTEELTNMEKEIVSKMINLKEVRIIDQCKPEIISEIQKLPTLECLHLDNANLNIKFKNSNVKTLLIDNEFYLKDSMTFNIDCPLETLIFRCLLSDNDLNIIFSSKYCKTLQKLEIGELIGSKLANIEQLSSLTDFTCNLLVYEGVLEPLIGLIYLKRLNLSSSNCDYFYSIFECISKLSNLEALTYSHYRPPQKRRKKELRNQVTGTEISHLVEMSKLTELDLSFNSLENVSQLSLMGNLKVLKLSDNYIADESLKDFENLVNLTILHLDNNKISNLGVEYLTNNVNLVELDLSLNRIKEDSLKNLGNLQNLTKLNLSHNVIRKGLRNVFECKRLNSLKIGSTQIRECLIELLNQEFDLEELDISNNNLSEQFIPNLENMRNLKRLNISDNPIGDNTIVSLGKLRKLTTLQANYCGISASGIVSFLDSPTQMYKDSKLILYLEDNNFTKKAIRSFVKHSESIEELVISQFQPFENIELLKHKIPSLIIKDRKPKQEEIKPKVKDKKCCCQ